MEFSELRILAFRFDFLIKKIINEQIEQNDYSFLETTNPLISASSGPPLAPLALESHLLAGQAEPRLPGRGFLDPLERRQGVADPNPRTRPPGPRLPFRFRRL